MVSSISNLPSDPADPATEDPRRFPSDEESSQPFMVLGRDVTGRDTGHAPHAAACACVLERSPAGEEAPLLMSRVVPAGDSYLVFGLCRRTSGIFESNTERAFLHHRETTGVYIQGVHGIYMHSFCQHRGKGLFKGRVS